MGKCVIQNVIPVHSKYNRAEFIAKKMSRLFDKTYGFIFDIISKTSAGDGPRGNDRMVYLNILINNSTM